MTAGTTRSTLGDGALPHVPVLHVFSDVDPEAAWKQASAEISLEVQLAFNGLVLLPYLKTYNGPDEAPGVLSWILTKASPQLLDAFVTARALEYARSGEPLVYGGVYSPHVTLGVSDSQPGNVSLPHDLLLRDGVTGRLAIGPIGKHGVFQEVYCGGW